jgi:hypothetical protein
MSMTFPGKEFVPKTDLAADAYARQVRCYSTGGSIHGISSNSIIAYIKLNYIGPKLRLAAVRWCTIII